MIKEGLYTSAVRTFLSASLVCSPYQVSQNINPFDLQSFLTGQNRAVENLTVERVFAISGREPISYLANVIKLHDYRAEGGVVIGLGEYHTDPSTGEFAEKLIVDLARQKLISFLAIEASPRLDADISHYQKTGEISPDLYKGYFSWHTDNHFQAIEAGRKEGLELIAIALDQSTSPRSYYDVFPNGSTEYMADQLGEYTRQNPGKNGIMLVGDMHVPNYGDIFKLYGAKYYSIFTFSAQSFPDNRLYEFYRSRFDKPLLLDSSSLTGLRKIHNLEMPYNGHPYLFNFTDAVLFLP